MCISLKDICVLKIEDESEFKKHWLNIQEYTLRTQLQQKMVTRTSPQITEMMKPRDDY